jgi:hypothetical protein
MGSIKSTMKLFPYIALRIFGVTFGVVLCVICGPIAVAQTEGEGIMALEEIVDGELQAVLTSIKRKLVDGKINEGINDLRVLTSRLTSDDSPDIDLMLVFELAEETEDPVLRCALANYLLSVAGGEDEFLTAQALKYLLQLFHREDFDEAAKQKLASLPLDNTENGRYVIRLIGIVELRDKEPMLQKLFTAKITDTDGMYGFLVQWVSALVLARWGDERALDFIIHTTAKESNEVVRATRYLPDLAYTLQPRAFDALRNYLFSENRLPQLKDTVLGEPVARYAAQIFAEYVEDCPIQNKNIQESDIPVIRAWAVDQSYWKLRAYKKDF